MGVSEGDSGRRQGGDSPHRTLFPLLRQKLGAPVDVALHLQERGFLVSYTEQTVLKRTLEGPKRGPSVFVESVLTLLRPKIDRMGRPA